MRPRFKLGALVLIRDISYRNHGRPLCCSYVNLTQELRGVVSSLCFLPCLLPTTSSSCANIRYSPITGLVILLLTTYHSSLPYLTSLHLSLPLPPPHISSYSTPTFLTSSSLDCSSLSSRNTSTIYGPTLPRPPHCRKCIPAGLVATPRSSPR